MKRHSAILFIGMLCLPCLVVDPRQVLDFFVPITAASVACDTVNLKVLAPGARQEASIAVHNRSLRTIQLTSPRTDCGCVVVNSSPQTLPPRSCKTLEVTVHAPTSPSEFTKWVVIGSADHPSIAWSAKIIGDVEAEMWAEPSELNLVSESGEDVESVVTIRRRHGYELEDIKSSSTKLQILETRESDGAVFVKVRAQCGLSFTEKESPPAILIQSAEDSTGPGLTVPVRCVRRAGVVFLPRAVDLSRLTRSELNGDTISTTVLAKLAPGLDPKDVDIAALLPWVRVQVQHVTQSTLKLDLLLDASQIRSGIDDAIVHWQLRDSLESGVLRATGYPQGRSISTTY